MAAHILVLGSINMDLVAYCDSYPKQGETILGTKFLKFHGGKGANQAVAAARLEARVAMLGALGNDSFAGELKTGLIAEGIDCKNIVTKDGVSSGVALITVDPDGDNSIIVISGANYAFRTEDVNLDRIKDVDCISSQFEILPSVITRCFVHAKHLSKTTVLNPAPIQDIDPELSAHTDYLVCNELECSTLIKEDVRLLNDQARERSLRSLAIPYCILTLGSKGVYIYAREEQFFKYYPAVPVTAKDTTAAGDSFIAAFLTELFSDNNRTGTRSLHDFERAVTFARHAAALTVTREGAQSSLPSLREVEVFIGKAAARSTAKE